MVGELSMRCQIGAGLDGQAKEHHPWPLREVAAEAPVSHGDKKKNTVELGKRNGKRVLTLNP